MHHLLRLAQILGTLALASLTASAQLTNGSFETIVPTPSAGNYALLAPGATDIQGWKAIESGVEWAIPSTYGGGLGAAADGLAMVDLANYTFSAGGIEQTFGTTAGQLYRVSFMGGTSSTFGRTGTGTIELSVNAATPAIFNLSNPNAQIAWVPFSLDFTAASASTTIAFANREDAHTHFAFLDNVSVTAIPEPASYTLAIGLGALVLVGLRRFLVR